MSKTSKVRPGGNNRQRLARARVVFRDWRRTRPFWAGLFTLVAALLLLYPPYASLKFGDVEVSLRTTAGITALVIGMVLIACGISFWMRPELRLPAGIVTLVLSVVAIVTANLGSFLIGTTMGLIGAALAIAWSPSRRSGKHGSADSAGGAGESSGTTPARGGVSKPSPVPRERAGKERDEAASPAGAVRIDGGEA
ncbi:hypothetical protein FHR84_003063 [Actinopolyspora biskrensis]|uniref:Uncharacterized protein n=1 Tax=Actinopolyspora biskrensis TaxID=1470178 RepID=A0A852Z371_9ACTN|nr:hypothetical protein [Actinopolyspora biskrensis]